MNNRIQIILPRNDLGQLLDGLKIRAKAWSQTADYLESGLDTHDLFVCEDCSNSEEARRIARQYEKIISSIELQVKKQRARTVSSKCREPTHSGYAIFRPYWLQGFMPACYDETGYPVTFATELEAQREIADNQLTRIQEFLDGHRDYEDAISTDEFVIPVILRPDGSISVEDGSTFGKIE